MKLKQIGPHRKAQDKQRLEKAQKLLQEATELIELLPYTPMPDDFWQANIYEIVEYLDENMSDMALGKNPKVQFNKHLGGILQYVSYCCNLNFIIDWMDQLIEIYVFDFDAKLYPEFHKQVQEKLEDVFFTFEKSLKEAQLECTRLHNEVDVQEDARIAKERAGTGS